MSWNIERHADGTVNFATPRLLTGTSATDRVDRIALKEAVRELFADDAEIALFYFAGHGYSEDTGGFLCGTDCKTGDDELSLAEVSSLARGSPAKNKIIILDSCHSGIAGERPETQAIAELKEGMTILTAPAANQYAMEVPGGGAGVFTNLFVDALDGAAANLVGDVTPGSVYAHIDQSLGPWGGQGPLTRREECRNSAQGYHVNFRTIFEMSPPGEAGRRIRGYHAREHLIDHRWGGGTDRRRNAEKVSRPSKSGEAAFFGERNY